MSAKLSGGSCLEGTPYIPVYSGPQAWLLDRLWRRSTGRPYQFGQAPFQRSEREQPDAGFRVQFHDKINVASGRIVATSNGAKQRQVTDAGALRIRLVCPQGGDDLFGQISRRCRAQHGPRNSMELTAAHPRPTATDRRNTTLHPPTGADGHLLNTSNPANVDDA